MQPRQFPDLSSFTCRLLMRQVKLLVIALIFGNSMSAYYNPSEAQIDQTLSEPPQVSSGRLITLNDFKSQYISPRAIRIWLPDGYSTDKRYSVLYMHDGQMLWDARVTWNKQEWGVDEAAGKLLKAGRLNDFIVVSTDNVGKDRYSDFFPAKALAFGSQAIQEFLRQDGLAAPGADNYLKYMVLELKPYIDKNYSTRPDAANTMVAGSSMGGLISMYAISEYPHIFGAAACLSTHWPGHEPELKTVAELPDMFISYMRQNFPKASKNGVNHRIYFDYGDQTLDKFYPPLQKKVDALMVELGYNESNWLTVFAPGDGHGEIAWNKRFPGVLTFLLGK